MWRAAWSSTMSTGMMGRVTRRVSSEKIVGRADELATVDAALDALVADDAARPKVLLVSGEAGIGKTRLLESLASRGRRLGAVVAIGGCLEHGSEIRPLGPIVEILTALLDSYPESGAEIHHDLGWLLDANQDDPEAGLPDPAQMYSLVGALIRRLAVTQPLVVAVEDLHWADRTTCELFTVLARARNLARVLLVGTFRSDELHRRHPLLPFIAELERAVRPERIELDPLDTGDINALAEAILDEEVSQEAAAALASRSGGNPFYAEELLASGLDDAGPPEPLRQLILARSQRLDKGASITIEAASTVAAPLAPDVLAAMTELPMSAQREALDRLCAEGFLDFGPRGFRFRHDLVREVFLDELMPGERTTLFGRAADALARHQPTRLGEIAHLRFRAAQLPAALAASVAAAAAASALGAAAEASVHYGRALDLWSRVDDPEAVAAVAHHQLLRRAAAACDMHRDFDRAVELGRMAVEELAGDDPSEEGAALEELCWHLWNSGAPGLDDTIARALEVVPLSPPTVTRARLEVRHSSRLRLKGRVEEAATVLRRAIAIAEAVGDASVHADALHSLGYDRAVIGDEAGFEMIREAAGLALQGSDPRIPTKIAINLMSALIAIGRPHEALEGLEQGVELCERAGLTPTHGLLLYGNALEAMELVGRWDDAATVMDELSERFSEESLDLWASAFVGWGEILLARGQYEAARWIYETGIEQYTTGYYLGGYPQVCCGYVEIAAAGLIEPLDLERLDEWLGGLPPGEQPAVARTLSVAARRMLPDRTVAAGDHERAVRRLADLIDRVERTVEESYVQRPVVFDLWAGQARIEMAESEGQPVSHRWQELAASWRRLRWPMAAAQAEFRAANALLISTGGRATTDRRRATELLTTARATATELQAGPLATDIDDLARRARIDLGRRKAQSGSGPDSPSAELPFGLTPREEEVLVLVVEGHSNGEIGSRLFVSTKTVSVHVSNILRKLGASNRIEAAAIARRHGFLR